MSWLIVIVAIVVSIGVHEFGHYLAALRLGVVPPIFSIGLGPSILKFSVPIKTTRSRGVTKIFSTEFRLCLLPLGGFVCVPPSPAATKLSVSDNDEPAKEVSTWKTAALVLITLPLLPLMLFFLWLVEPGAYVRAYRIFRKEGFEAGIFALKPSFVKSDPENCFVNDEAKSRIIYASAGPLASAVFAVMLFFAVGLSTGEGLLYALSSGYQDIINACAGGLLGIKSLFSSFQVDGSFESVSLASTRIQDAIALYGWHWGKALRILATINLFLAMVNLLPIPGLDGSHIAQGVLLMALPNTWHLHVAKWNNVMAILFLSWLFGASILKDLSNALGFLK